MRATLAFAILLFGLSGAAPEPEYSSLYANDFHAAAGHASASLIEIESSTGRADRLTGAASQPREMSIEVLNPENDGKPVQVASADADMTPDIAPATNAASDSNQRTEVSLGDLCNALFTSAQDNDLPVQFFANLIWQESRLRDDAVSKKGAMGIAQFMPQVAIERGLDDPFDPMQAIPASAQLLRTLRLQFGNLGFVAAAYNAGARRVAEWLERRGNLPRETRDYVVRVTGLSVDAWRSMPVDSDALTFVQHLPCRSLPAFANVEQEQSEQAQLEQAKMEQADLEEPLSDDAPLSASEHSADSRGADKRGADSHVAARRHDRPRQHHEARRAPRERHPARREAEHAPRGAREKHKSA
jgi:hypothetical protein